MFFFNLKVSCYITIFLAWNTSAIFPENSNVCRHVIMHIHFLIKYFCNILKEFFLSFLILFIQYVLYSKHIIQWTFHIVPEIYQEIDFNYQRQWHSSSSLVTTLYIRIYFLSYRDIFIFFYPMCVHPSNWFLIFLSDEHK